MVSVCVSELFAPTYKHSCKCHLSAYLHRPTLHPCRLNEFNALDVKEPDEIPVEEVWVTMNLRTRIPQLGRSSRKGGRIQCQIPQSWRSSTMRGRIQCRIPQSWRSTRREEFKVESLNCDGARGRRIQYCCFVGQRSVISKNCVVFVSHL
jgi:hypothetical protein